MGEFESYVDIGLIVGSVGNNNSNANGNNNLNNHNGRLVGIGKLIDWDTFLLHIIWFLSDGVLCPSHQLIAEGALFITGTERRLFLNIQYSVFSINYAPAGIRTRVTASRGPYDWPDYTTGAQYL